MRINTAEDVVFCSLSNLLMLAVRSAGEDRTAEDALRMQIKAAEDVVFTVRSADIGGPVRC